MWFTCIYQGKDTMAAQFWRFDPVLSILEDLPAPPWISTKAITDKDTA